MRGRQGWRAVTAWGDECWGCRPVDRPPVRAQASSLFPRENGTRNSCPQLQCLCPTPSCEPRLGARLHSLFTVGSPDSAPRIFNGIELNWCVSGGWGVLCAKSPSVLSLGDPMNCSPPGSSVHGSLPARTLPCPPPGDLPDPGIEPAFLTSLAQAGRFFTPWGLGSYVNFLKGSLRLLLEMDRVGRATWKRLKR